MKTFSAVVHQEGKWFIAECPEIGTVSQGENLQEAVANLREATEVYLEEFPLDHEIARPVLTTFDVAEHA